MPAGALVEHHLRGTGPEAWADLRVTLRALTGAPRVLLLDGDWSAGEQADADVAADVVHRLGATTLVSIAVLSGEISGPALRLALACGLRVAAPDTVVRVTEVVAGDVPPTDVLAGLHRMLGPAGALELAVTARPMGAEEAVGSGLALAGDGADARDLAAAILAAPDEAVRATIAALRGAV